MTFWNKSLWNTVQFKTHGYSNKGNFLDNTNVLFDLSSQLFFNDMFFKSHGPRRRQMRFWRCSVLHNENQRVANIHRESWFVTQCFNWVRVSFVLRMLGYFCKHCNVLLYHFGWVGIRVPLTWSLWSFSLVRAFYHQPETGDTGN